MSKTRMWTFGGGTLESNIEGFELLRGDKLRAAIMSLPDDDPLKQEILAAQADRSPEGQDRAAGLIGDESPVRDSGCAQTSEAP